MSIKKIKNYGFSVKYLIFSFALSEIGIKKRSALEECRARDNEVLRVGVHEYVPLQRLLKLPRRLTSNTTTSFEILKIYYKSLRIMDVEVHSKLRVSPTKTSQAGSEARGAALQQRLVQV